MNINVSEIYQEELKKLENEDFVRQQIRKGLEETLNKSIKNSLESWDFRKIIEKKFIETAGEEVKNITFKGYGEFFKEQIINVMDCIEKNELQNLVYESTKEFFETEQEIQLVDLIENFRKSNMNDDEDDYDKHFFLEIDNEFHAWASIYIDEDSGVYSKYNAKYIFRICKKTNKLLDLKIESKEVKGLFRLGIMDSFEKRLLKAYFNKTNIIGLEIYEDDCNTRLSNADY